MHKDLYAVATIIFLVSLSMRYQNWVPISNDEKYVKQALELVFRTQALNLNISAKTIEKTKQECVQRDYKKLIHPETALSDFYIYRKQAGGDSIRTYIRQKYFDAQPWHESYQSGPLTKHLDKKYSRYSTLYMHANSYRKDRHVTEHCLFEKLMQFPSPAPIFNKVPLAHLMNKRIERLSRNNASAQCLRDAQFQKKSYILDNPQECVEFFERANVEYNNNSTKEVYNYVKKTNQHDQKGTELAFKAVMKIYQEIYDYGRNCSQPPRSIIMQEYINNPLLIKGRKFDIRIHIIVESTNPLRVYLYRRFYLMKCSYPYAHDEFRNQSHICSAGYQRKMHKLYKSENMTEEFEKTLPISEITEEVTYQQFADYLIQEGKIQDRSWVDSYMIPEMEGKFQNYFQSFFDDEGPLDDPRYGGYFACEFDVDDKMNFWLLECTPMPNMIPGPTSTVMRDFQMGLHSRGLPLLIKYQRQRFNKIRNFVLDFAKQIKLNGNKATLKKSLPEEVRKLVQEDDINDPSIDDYFVRINAERALASCKGVPNN